MNADKKRPEHFLDGLLNPRSIAFYGANEKLIENMGTQQLLNLIDNGYKGKIYPIHPRLEKVLGLKVYRNIAEVPETPDLAVVILPKRVVPEIFAELGEKGVKYIVLVTAGFRELGNNEEEKNLNRIAEKYGIRFLGPNCLGFQNTHAYYSDSDDTCIINFTWVNYKGVPGNVSIASQSGTFASHINFLAQEIGLNINKCISVGNEANIDLCDCLEYFAQDPYTDVIALYIEEIKRGRLFRKLAAEITRHKPIIAYFVGGSETGASAVAGHTGAMAGNDSIYNGVFRQTGVIRVYSLEEMLDTAVLFSRQNGKKLPSGKRVGIVTNAGGPGVAMADRADRVGLEVPKFAKDLVKKLEKYLPPTAGDKQASNPLDFTFSINPEVFYYRVPALIAKSGEVDALLIYGAYGPDFFTYSGIGNKFVSTPEMERLKGWFMEIVEASIDRLTRILKKVPIIFVNFLGTDDAVVEYLMKKGFTVYRYPHRAVDALRNLIRYGIYRKKLEDTPENIINDQT